MQRILIDCPKYEPGGSEDKPKEKAKPLTPEVLSEIASKINVP